MQYVRTYVHQRGKYTSHRSSHHTMQTTYNCWLISKHKHKHGVKRVCENIKEELWQISPKQSAPQTIHKMTLPTHTHTPQLQNHNHNSIRANQYNPLITNGHHKQCGWTVNGVRNNQTNTTACYVHDCWAGTTKNLRQLSVPNWA